MALSQQVINQPSNQINGALLEKVIIGNDLSGLNSMEKVQYVKSMCQTLGLNPVTKPIQLMKFQGKETPYFTKDATEQLRKINNVSIFKIDTKILEGGIYVVTAYASTPDGRQDSATGVLSISGLKGESLANAMMKAETKSKRRVTLSICGLGFIDESEVDSIPNAKKIEISSPIKNETIEEDNSEIDFVNFMHEIELADSLDKLKSIFMDITKVNFKTNPDLLKKLIDAKDKKKNELTVKEFNQEIDENTGEVLS